MITDKYIDEEEKEIFESLDSIDYSKLKVPSSEEQDLFKSAAKEYIKKETKMNIRIDEFELDKIKEFADNEGLKYQTFVKSILHKYITGQLIEKRRIIN